MADRCDSLRGWRRLTVLCAGLAILCGSAVAYGQDAADEPYDIWKTKRLTGDWGGVRTDLEDFGIKFSPTLGTMHQWNLRGGLNTHNADSQAGKMFWNMELDFDKMFGLKGATFFGRCIQTWQSGIRSDVGSRYHPFYSAGSGGDQSWTLDKWWYRQRLWDDRVEFRFGRLLSADFLDQNAYADNYLNKFMNQALYKVANTPHTKGVGLMVKAWPIDWLFLTGAVIDPDAGQSSCSHGWGGFDTAFGGEDKFRSFWEVGFVPKHLLPDWMDGTYRLGWWHDPTRKAVYVNSVAGVTPKTRTGDMGWYLSFDQLVYKENPDDSKDKQGLGVFARYGFAHDDVNIVNHAWSAGLAYTGLVPERDADTLGFGIAQSILSKQYRSNVDPLADRETVYELYYSVKVTPWCWITPDLQVITNPGGDRDDRDAVVGGVRFKIVF